MTQKEINRLVSVEANIKVHQTALQQLVNDDQNPQGLRYLLIDQCHRLTTIIEECAEIVAEHEPVQTKTPCEMLAIDPKNFSKPIPQVQKEQTLPESPNDMPMEWHGDENAIRNCLVQLCEFRGVDIRWEKDVHASVQTGEVCGLWEVEIETHRRIFTAEHEDILNALWFAFTLASAANDKAYEEREQARAKALAKLTDADKKALGIAI